MNISSHWSLKALHNACTVSRSLPSTVDFSFVKSSVEESRGSNVITTKLIVSACNTKRRYREI